MIWRSGRIVLGDLEKGPESDNGQFINFDENWVDDAQSSKRREQWTLAQ